MQAVTRRLGHQCLEHRQNLRLIHLLTTLALIILMNFRLWSRYASTLTAKATGHIVRKGTGGRSSVRIQPVFVVDVASAIVAALKDDGSCMGKVYELGGPEIFPVFELAELMFDMIREWPRYVKIPLPVAKAIAMPREILLKRVPFPIPTPSIFNLNVIEALTSDTLVSKDEKIINFFQGQREEEAKLFNLDSPLMFPQVTHGCFEGVNLRGRNIGANMIARHGYSGGSQGSCSINIYISNNVQGVNNSVLVGGEVKQGDPGVCLSFRGLKLDRGLRKTSKIKTSESTQGFCWMILFAFIAMMFLYACCQS